MPKQGSPHKGLVQAYGDCDAVKSWGRGNITRKKFVWSVRPPAGVLTAFTQLRTDTTLDLSQKAEKVWLSSHHPSYTSSSPFSFCVLQSLINSVNN